MCFDCRTFVLKCSWAGIKIEIALQMVALHNKQTEGHAGGTFPQDFPAAQSASMGR